MKITIEHEGLKAVLEDESAVDITDALDMIERALVQAGFMEKRVEAGFVFKAQQIKERRKHRGDVA